jgi:hypothetical protein
MPSTGPWPLRCHVCAVRCGVVRHRLLCVCVCVCACVFVCVCVSWREVNWVVRGVK